MQFVYLAVLFFCCLSCSVMNKDLGLPDDNPFEEGIEYLIEEETGVKMNFTPKTAS